KGELKSQLGKIIDAGLFDAGLASLIEEGAVESRSDQLRVAGAPRWTPALQQAQDRVVEALSKARHSVPELSTPPPSPRPPPDPRAGGGERLRRGRAAPALRGQGGARQSGLRLHESTVGYGRAGAAPPLRDAAKSTRRRSQRTDRREPQARHSASRILRPCRP